MLSSTYMCGLFIASMVSQNLRRGQENILPSSLPRSELKDSCFLKNKLLSPHSFYKYFRYSNGDHRSSRLIGNLRL